MTTIRRTLSPVPRPGTLLGEACSVSSPLSKCSSCEHESVPNSSFTSTEYAFLHHFQAFVLNLFSKRTCKSLEKQKPKANVWRRSLFHFFLCFLVGIFVGFTPIVSIKTSTILTSREPDFSFEQVGNVQLYDVNNVKTLATNNISNDIVLLRKIEGLETDFGKLLIIVTPTYPRMFQAYYLNRLAHTLRLLEPPLLWIVVEMSSQSDETSELLRKSGVMYRHLVCKKNITEIKDLRNVGLLHIETHRLDGIVYFADDINVYSSELFHHMRQIRRFGVWPVSKLKTNTRLATFVGPICNGTQIIGWHTSNFMKRFHRFHADLSGFAFNSNVLWDPKRWNRLTLEPIRFLDTVTDGFQVSTLIEQIVEDETQMEGISNDCSKIFVWHLPIESASLNPQKWSLNNNLDAI
ncbi:hypothetical protein L2E82_04325 [Cichorium intybus]|uniref:Uncharacterized protein n=1 Tax=Cichorium intybus TaxID=13427 RepID=A0ACB9H6H1_CICIN|nr:hypothetical protein L2E82_04325 [Cichorium intybus]